MAPLVVSQTTMRCEIRIEKHKYLVMISPSHAPTHLQSQFNLPKRDNISPDYFPAETTTNLCPSRESWSLIETTNNWFLVSVSDNADKVPRDIRNRCSDKRRLSREPASDFLFLPPLPCTCLEDFSGPAPSHRRVICSDYGIKFYRPQGSAIRSITIPSRSRP